MEGYCKTVDNPFISPTINKKHVLFLFSILLKPL